MRRFFFWFAICLILPTSALGDSAQDLIETTGVQGGLIVHVGCGDGAWTADLRIHDRYLVQGLDTDAELSAEGRSIWRKPWPEDIDQWTHWLHGPDGNAVARDRVAGPPRRLQWMAQPSWARLHDAPSTTGRRRQPAIRDPP